MFLRRYNRTKDGKPHTYYALVESVRTDAGPRQRIVAYLGELNHDQQRRWQRTVTFYNRDGAAQQFRLFPEDVPLPMDCAPVADAPADGAAAADESGVVRVRLDRVGWSNGRRFGDVYLAWWLWRLLRLDAIVDRHVPAGEHTVRPADVVAIEVINRLCGPTSEFALAEHWYAATGLEDLLGVPDDAVTKDRLYRTMDALLAAKAKIERDLQSRLGELFRLDYELLLYDLTSTYFEGLAEQNDLARFGYSRDRRSDCKQVVLALVVTRDGFPLAHETLAGNTQDVTTVRKIVETVEQRYGRAERVWVMDRGMISEESVEFLNEPGRRYLLATRRSELMRHVAELRGGGWQQLPDRDVDVKTFQRDGVNYLLARSPLRRAKERAMRRRQRRELKLRLTRLATRAAAGRLKKRDKILEAIGRMKATFPKAVPFVTIRVSDEPRIEYTWQRDKFRDALAADGAYLLRSNQAGWSPQEFWETYMQLTVVERAFRVLKSELLLRPIWHQYSRRVEAHIMICVLAYALWKTLDHLAKQAGLETVIRKPDAENRPGPKPRPMTPETILRELSQIQIGDIELEATDGRKLLLRRVARPNADQARILAALKLDLPDRFSPDHLL